MDKSPELRIEQFKDMSNIQHELLQSFYDGRTVVERYLDRSITINVHFVTSKDSLCITFIKANASEMPDSCKSFVFVGIGEDLNELRPVASIVRLQPLKHCDVFPIQSSETPFSTLEVLFGIYNNKLRLLYDTFGVKTSQFINQVIQSFPQVLNGFSNKSSNSQGCRTVDGGSGCPNRHVQLFPFDINDSLLIIQGNFLGYHFGEGLNLRSQSIQVFPCPVNLLVSAIQRVHMLYYPEGELHAQKIQKTPKGHKIPLPTKNEFLKNLEKTTKKLVPHSPLEKGENLSSDAAEAEVDFLHP